MNRITYACALIIIAGTASADLSTDQKLAAACLGWQLDRANFATMISKQHDLRSALLTISDSDQSGVAQQLTVNLSKLIEVAESAFDASGKPFETSCAPAD